MGRMHHLLAPEVPDINPNPLSGSCCRFSTRYHPDFAINAICLLLSLREPVMEKSLHERGLTDLSFSNNQEFCLIELPKRSSPPNKVEGEYLLRVYDWPVQFRLRTIPLRTKNFGWDSKLLISLQV